MYHVSPSLLLTSSTQGRNYGPAEPIPVSARAQIRKRGSSFILELIPPNGGVNRKDPSSPLLSTTCRLFPFSNHRYLMTCCIMFPQLSFCRSRIWRPLTSAVIILFISNIGLECTCIKKIFKDFSGPQIPLKRDKFSIIDRIGIICYSGLRTRAVPIPLLADYTDIEWNS